MIEIISGLKGHGKTKVLIQKVNDDIKLTKGTIVYLDKNNKHMYELSNQIRLIVVPEFNITNTDMFIGFIAGILSQDHDLDKIYLDSFLTTACIEDNLKFTKLADKAQENVLTTQDPRTRCLPCLPLRALSACWHQT